MDTNCTIGIIPLELKSVTEYHHEKADVEMLVDINDIADCISEAKPSQALQ